ncbi:site-specific integrase [Acinetobacter sp. MD2]|uniref:tyrosine-type recombinase/integrase n=1 Tax=Acinetobacter sp. MD2 TaxID=2600066 RepID=UPI002D1E687C|nr:site-specific integrase [Acinetobacter sp. MD2]MEB3766371.1 site-specific integrase [Acinetobacter sp. MD2]
MLTKMQIDAIKTTSKIQKIHDSEMLYLFVSPTGRKTWKVLFTLDGKKNTITLGEYPKVLNAKDARLRRDEIKKLVAEGTNPTEQKRQDRLQDLSKMSFADLINLYAEKVTPHKRGGRVETVILNGYIRAFPKLMKKPVKELGQLDMIQFRDERLKTVKSATVARDLGLLSAVFKYARQELRIMDSSPLTDVAKPKQSPSRNRRISQDEIEQILQGFKYDGRSQPVTKKQQTAWCFLFAIETAMRAGEITGLKWANVFDKHVELEITKNGTPRKVPLSKRAIELLSYMRGIDETSVCTVKNSVAEGEVGRGSLSAYFNQVVTGKLKIDDLTFHDTRHEAISRMVKNLKIPVEVLAKITGHKTISILINTYYNPDIEELADHLHQVDDPSIISFKKRATI